MSGFGIKAEPLSNQDLATLEESLRVLTDVVERQRWALNQMGRIRSGSPQAQLEHSLNELNVVLPNFRTSVQNLERELRDQERERDQLQALCHVSQVVNSSLDLEQVLNQVMDQIIQLTKAERGFLMLLNQDNEMEFKTARNMDQETIQGSSFEISRSIVERVASQGTPIVTTNAQEDPRFSAQESVVAFSLRSILCVPLRVKDRVTGVIYADNRIRAGLFSDQDRDLLAAFANQGAVAIENARLFESVVNAKNLMDNIFTSITSGVITTNVRDQITLFNRAAERILHQHAESIVGLPYAQVLVCLRDQISPLMQTVKMRDEPVVGWEIESDLPPRGTVNLSLNLSPLKDANQSTTGVAIVIDDLTERRRLEARTRYIRDVLMSYVAPQVAEQLLVDPEMLRLGGARRTLTTFFADIRGFTTFSENLSPEKLMDVLNGYLSLGAEAVLLHEGTLDKFQGDMVMAFFNAPLKQPGHALRAVRAAMAMRTDIAAYHQRVDAEMQLSFGIGINTGDAVFGNVGTAQIKNYTVIGDSVNLAKRLQEEAGPEQIILGEATFELVKDHVVAKALPPIKVKGRSALEQTYELIDLKPA